jgi:DNA-binding PadR family transcriptional regulator
MPSDIANLIEPTLLILVALADEPKHGYSIMQDIEAMTGWSMRAGTLYGALARMERLGWIEEIQTDDYRRRPYALTAAGRLELVRHLTLLDVIAKTGHKRIRHRGTTRRRARHAERCPNRYAVQ